MGIESQKLASAKIGVGWLVLATIAASIAVTAATGTLAHGAEAKAAESLHVAVAVHEHATPHLDPDDSAHAYPPEGVPVPLAWLGKFHPVATHFPIALFSVAALAELLLIWRPRDGLREVVRFSLWVGAVGALLAAPFGWFFAGLRMVDDEWVMTAHRWAGTATAIWALVILSLCERTHRRGADRSALRTTIFLGAALVGVTGFLGGSLIYGLDHYAW